MARDSCAFLKFKLMKPKQQLILGIGSVLLIFMFIAIFGSDDIQTIETVDDTGLVNSQDGVSTPEVPLDAGIQSDISDTMELQVKSEDLVNRGITRYYCYNDFMHDPNVARVPIEISWSPSILKVNGDTILFDKVEYQSCDQWSVWEYYELDKDKNKVKQIASIREEALSDGYVNQCLTLYHNEVEGDIKVYSTNEDDCYGLYDYWTKDKPKTNG